MNGTIAETPILSLSDKVTLARSTTIEPLVNNWCAWSFLLPPVPASLYFEKYQLPLLDSFIEQPESHAKAAADPQLSGGPFVNLSPDRVPQAKEYRDRSVRTYDANRKLAAELAQFATALVKECDGLALERWYQRVPDSLKRFVELVYDYHHRPHIRFIEPLLYQSNLYRRESQALRLFTLERDRDRPYFLNTPRLPNAAASELFIDAAFDSDTCATLVNLATEPVTFGALRENQSLSDAQARAISGMLMRANETPPTAPQNTYTYLGHASVMVHWNGTTIMQSNA